MKKHFQRIGAQKINYYIHGLSPELLIFSGTHGDEFEVIDVLRKEIKERLSVLPDFLYLPIVSPSAYVLETRHNKEGVDLNRHFFANTHIVEARVVLSILKSYHFEVAMSWHEDVHEDRFYLYDSGRLPKNRELKKLRGAIKNIEVGLLNGCDDPHDECLGFEFADGYISRVPTRDSRPNGSLEAYLIKSKIANRVFGVEVPGTLKIAKKRQVVSAVLNILIPYCFPS